MNDTEKPQDGENGPEHPLPAPQHPAQSHPARVYGQAVDAGFMPAPPTPAPAPTLLEELRPWSGPETRRPTFSPPVFGALSVIFGVTAFYKATLLLAPLALIAGLFACLKRQWGWGLIGMLSAVAALAVDPYFWGLAGLYWLARVLGLMS